MSSNRGLAFFRSRKKRGASPVTRPTTPAAYLAPELVLHRLVRVESRLVQVETKLDHVLKELVALRASVSHVDEPSIEQIEHEAARPQNEVGDTETKEQENDE